MAAIPNYSVTLTKVAAIPNNSVTSPAILSTLYGYDDCIGGVNNFTTEDDYMEELKR